LRTVWGNGRIGITCAGTRASSAEASVCAEGHTSGERSGWGGSSTGRVVRIVILDSALIDAVRIGGRASPPVVVRNTSARGRTPMNAKCGNRESPAAGLAHVDGSTREDGGAAGSRASLEEVAEDGVAYRSTASAVRVFVVVLGVRHCDWVTDSSATSGNWAF